MVRKNKVQCFLRKQPSPSTHTISPSQSKHSTSYVLCSTLTQKGSHRSTFKVLHHHDFLRTSLGWLILAEHKYGSLSETSGTVSYQQPLNLFRLPPPGVTGRRVRRRVLENLQSEKNMPFSLASSIHSLYINLFLPFLLFFNSFHSFSWKCLRGIHLYLLI